MRRVAPSDSQKFMLFWVAFIAGIAVGSTIAISASLLFWLFGLWVILLLSGQDERIETACCLVLGVIGGLTIWQLTGGEAWVSTEFLKGIIVSIEEYRAVLIDRIFLFLPEPHGSLLTGILIGNRAKLDPDLLETFRTVGLTHLIAVSGYNLSILTSNIRSIFWPILGRRAIFVALAVIIIFVILSGAPPSILRAAVMASSLLVAQYLGRPSRSINVLVFAAGLLALLEPKIIFEIGFQLSLIATYGLIRLGPVIVSALERFGSIPETLRLIIGETVAATLVTAPLIAMYFDRISIVSPVSNLLVLPIMPLLMGLGIVGCLLLFLIPVLGQYLIQISWPLLEWIIWISGRLAALPYASRSLAMSDWVALAILGLIIIGTEILFHWWRRRTDEPELILRAVRA